MTTVPVTAPAPPTAFPLWPLVATTSMQTLATMAAYTIPALAPVVARSLSVDGALIGYFVSVVYGVGIVSSLLAASYIHRFGAVRVSQFVLMTAAALVLICAQGTVWSVAAGAVALGVGYGATAPSSTHLIVPRTPPPIMNLVLSIRQIGVPLGGVLGAVLMPPLALRLGWQNALMLQLVPIFALMLLLEIPRRTWDAHRTGRSVSLVQALRQPLALLATSSAIRRLTWASIVYSGVQLCFVAFMTVHLTSRAGFGLIAAGWALATYQISGVVSRPIWGWMADKLVPARVLLAAQGFVMAGAAVAAGLFSADWSMIAVLGVCMVAGATASGYTGIAYAEFARLGGDQRTEATGLGSAAMFTGVMAMPSLAALLITWQGSYRIAYWTIAAVAVTAGLALAIRPRD